MKTFLLASIAALATTVIAQSNPSLIPDCAKSCLGDISSLGSEIGCGQFDYKCICSNKNFISAISCCVSKKCSTADQQSTLSFANTVCKVADVTLPSSASCAPGEQPTGLNGAGGSASGSGSSGASSATMTGSGSITGSSTGSMTGSTTGSMTMTSMGSSSAGSASAATASSATSAGGAAHFVLQGAGAASGLVAALAALL